MGGLAHNASSITFTGSINDPLGLPIEQLLLLLLGPVGIVVGLLYVCVRLFAGFIIVAVVRASDVLGTGDSQVLVILLALPPLNP